MAKEMTQTEEEARVMVSAIIDVWDRIGGDAEPLCDTNAEAVEMCIDAGRLLMVSREAERLLQSWVWAYGYPNTLKRLAKRVSLL